MQNPDSDRPFSGTSAASRVCRYPDTINPIKREIHAPCKTSKFRIFSGWSRGRDSKRENSADVKTGNLLKKYEDARSNAVGTLRFLGKDREIIDVDDDAERETVKGDISEDSSFEEVEIVENEEESLEGCNGDVGKLIELDGEIRKQNLQPSCSSVVSEDLAPANLKAYSAGKVLDIVSNNWELDVPLHKKLLNSDEKRDNNLSRLSFEIELIEGRLATFQLQRPAKKAENVVKELFMPLTKEEDDEVAGALSNAKRRKVLVAHENSNIEITGEVLQCLKTHAWLNDEVINLYFELLKEREKREPQKFLKCHFFNTFFYKKLIGGRSGYDFKSVRRWTTQRRYLSLSTKKYIGAWRL